MRKNIKKMVLHKETLLNLSDVMGSHLLPLTNAQHLCNTVQPCSSDCASQTQCATEAVTLCNSI